MYYQIEQKVCLRNAILHTDFENVEKLVHETAEKCAFAIAQVEPTAFINSQPITNRAQYLVNLCGRLKDCNAFEVDGWTWMLLQTVHKLYTKFRSFSIKLVL